MDEIRTKLIEIADALLLMSSAASQSSDETAIALGSLSAILRERVLDAEERLSQAG